MPNALHNAKGIIWLAVYLTLCAFLHFSVIPAVVDADTAYHAAVGQLISEHGLLYSFPWTPFSWLADHYADKELIFHLLFVPLAKLPWLTAAKIIGTVLGAAFLFTTYCILSCENIPYAGVWALLPIITSDVFLYRFSLVRPHLLSLSLALLLLWSAFRKRYLLLGLVAVLYPWSYVAFWQLPLIFLCIVESARYLSGERIQWKPSVIVATGILIGFAAHPNSINLLKFNWIHMYDVLIKNAWQAKGGIELGQEFEPFHLYQWGRWLLAAVAMTLAGLYLGWRRRKEDAFLLALSLAALLFALLSAKTARFAEYFIPLSAVAMAVASQAIPWRKTVIVVFTVTLAYSWTPLSETLRDYSFHIDRLPPELAAWMQKQIPVGSQVFTTEWGHTGTLMLALPDRKFIVALDPTLFSINNPELYRLWYEIPRNPRPGIAETIKQRFGARYIVSFDDEHLARFYQTMSREPHVKPLLVTDQNWTVFEIVD